MKGLLALLGGSGNTGIAAGLPAGQNLVEGTEASLMVGAAAANSSWRRATVATVAALFSLAPFLAGLWFLYKYEPGQYIDYAIAVIIFAIGVREVREGLEERPSGAGARRFALDGPLGIDPADPAQVKRFQGERGLEEDGVIGPRTRGALLAELGRRGEAPRPNRLGVDVTDEASVRGFQRRVGLPASGVIDERTQGALAAEAALPLSDPTDPAAIRRFQREHRLEETGVVDERTQGALRAVRRAGGPERAVAQAGEPAGWIERHFREPYGIDLTSDAEVARFQRDRGLPDSGVVDARTQGALRAEVERRHRLGLVDPVDPTAMCRFQESHGLTATGVLDEPTRVALQAELDDRGPTSEADRVVLGVDPTEPASIERFQALHDVDRTGVIDEATREALREAAEWTAGVDPSDPETVRRFQAASGLEATAVVDPETQGALRLYRTELARRHGEDAGPAEADWYPLDPTDAGSIASFQRDRGLPDTGTIDRRTQAALQAAAETRAAAALAEAERSEQGRGLIAKYKDAWPAYFGVLLEGGEAGLFTMGVAHGTGSWYVSAIAGGAAFALPWALLVVLRSWIASWPKWLFELTIGAILVAASTIFGLFRATGIFG